MEIFKIRLYFFIDWLYGILLSIIKHSDRVIKMQDLNDISVIKEINKTAYADSAEFCHVMDDVNTLSELCDYLCCDNISQIEYLVTEEFYIFIVNHFDSLEIVDFAAKGGKCTNIFKIIDFVANTVTKTNKRVIWMKTREDTSYPIIKRFEKIGKIRILADREIQLNNEKSHKLKIQVIK